VKLDKGFYILLTATIVAGVLVMLQSGLAHTLQIAVGAAGLFGILLPKIGAGVFIAATIPVLVPRERIAALIGRESGVKGLATATLAGAVLPGGPSMAYPLTASLLASGADLGAGLAFVSGWSLLNLNRTLIWELSFLPPQFVGLRILVSLLLPLAIGWAARAFMARA
jgi:uncharacterized membrane protein YraQ (UPF0718 family)